MKLRFAALLLVCLLPSKAWTWDTTGSFYLGGVAPLMLGDICDSTRFPLTQGTCSGGAGNPDWQVELTTALGRWHGATTNFQFITAPEQGASVPGECNAGDVNSAFFLDDICGFAEFGDSTLAVALTSSFFDGVSLHSDVIFNTAFTWDAFDDAMSNHGGDIDFRRVAVHEFGHVLGLGHTTHEFAIMAPFIQEALNSPQPDDLAGVGAIYGTTLSFAIPDQNGNSADEIVHVRRTPASEIIATIRDGSTGDLLRSMNILDGGYMPVSAVLLPDEDSSGAPELAVLTMRLSDLRAVVEIRNIAGSESPRTITYAIGLTPFKMLNIGDADGNGVSELAVLGVRESDLVPLVQTRNSFGAAVQRTILFSSQHSPLDMEVILDPLEVAPPRLAVLMTSWLTLGSYVELRNAIGAPTKRRLTVRSGVTPIDLAVVNDSAVKVSVLSVRDSDGKTLVDTKNVFGVQNVTSQFFPFGFTPLALTSVEDANGDNQPELVILTRRESDGRVNMQIRDLDGSDIRSFNFPTGFEPAGPIFVVADADGDTFPEVAVQLSRQSDARVRVDANNAAGPNTATSNFVWISPP